VTQKKLDLFQLAARIVAQAGTRPSKIMRGQFGNPELARVLLHYVPDDLLRDLCPPNNAPPTNTSKNPTVRDLRGAQPIVDGLFYPIRHRHSADMPSLSHQINNGPMVFPALKMVEVQIDEFSSTESAS
jgi:hypothetical protein